MIVCACRGWSAAQLQNVAGLVQLKRLPYNTVVIEQGTQADCTFFIKTGEVRVVRRMQADAQGTLFWAALRKDPLLAPKYAPTSTKHRRFDGHPCCPPNMHLPRPNIAGLTAIPSHAALNECRTGTCEHVHPFSIKTSSPDSSFT